jgi:hypothetical protein
MKTKNLHIAGLVVLLSAFSTVAHASLQITIDDGFSAFTVVDGGFGDLNSASGQVTFVNGGGHWFSGFVALVVSSVSNTPGTPLIAALNTTQVDVTSSATKSLSISVFDDTFTMPGFAGDELLVVNSITGNYASGGSATASQTTELDGAPTPVAAVAVSSADVNDTDETIAELVRGGSPFTLETRISASIGANTNVNFTHTSSAIIPEPMTLAIWTGVFSVGALAFFRRQRSA